MAGTGVNNTRWDVRVDPERGVAEIVWVQQALRGALRKGARMDTQEARILVIGAGVNGSICAARLREAGVDVTVLARGKRVEEIRSQGLVLEDVLRKTSSVTPVPVVDELRPDDVYDYVLVVVRKNQVAALLPTLQANRSPNIVFMVNNPSGPGEWIEALGRERVMLGFVFGAGRREGSVIRGITELNKGLAGSLMRTPFGETDGAVTPRLQRLVGLFNDAGLHAGVSTRITDYLATHAATVAVFASFAMARGYDRASMARYTRADLGLMVEAMREMLPVLRANGIRVTPKGMAAWMAVPRWIHVELLRVMLPSRFTEAGAAYHLSQAPDEMEQLIRETRTLVEKSGLKVPALREVLWEQPVAVVGQLAVATVQGRPPGF